MNLSIVATFYRAESYINEFCELMLAEAAKVASDYELILVNDGSPDNAESVVRQRIEKGDPIRLVSLARNAGHHKAMITGLEHAFGDFVFLIDSDLEEPPELVAQFMKVLEENPGLDVVYGVQQSRKGAWVERNVNGWFWFFFNLLSSVQLTPNLITARLMRQKYVRALCSYKETDLLFFGLCSLVGFAQMPYTVQKGSRGDTTYSIARKISIIIDSVTSFSSKPLEMVFYLGIFSFVTSVVYAVYLTYRRLVLHFGVEGWTSVVISAWFLGGLILCSIGIIGIYIAKIYIQVKERPRVLIKDELVSEALKPALKGLRGAGD